jgi:hypothetical protein
MSLAVGTIKSQRAIAMYRNRRRCLTKDHFEFDYLAGVRCFCATRKTEGRRVPKTMGIVTERLGRVETDLRYAGEGGFSLKPVSIYDDPGPGRIVLRRHETAVSIFLIRHRCA